MTDRTAAAKLLADAPDVTLLAHVTPDADALGSALALGLALHRRGATVRVSFGAPDETPETLRFLDSANLVVPVDQVPAAPPLLVTLDTASQQRLGVLADRVDATIAAGGQVLVVDHHASNPGFGTHNFIDVHAEATAVLVLELLDELGVEVDEPIARCVYAGVVTDTSSFSRAKPETLRTGARLVEAGVNGADVCRRLMDSHPFAWLPMLSSVLGRARLEPEAVGGRGLVHTAVLLSDLDGVRLEEVESVVDIVRTTTEAAVALVLKQVSPTRWTGSLRAVGVDVSAAAKQLGGGGHKQAAGFTQDGELAEVLDRVRAVLS